MALLAALLLASSPGPDLGGRLAAELSRLDRKLAAIDTARLPKEAVALVDQGRKLVIEVRGTNPPLLQLYRLRDAYVPVEALAFIAQNAEAAGSVARLTALADRQRAAFERPLPPVSGSALHLALQQTAANRADKLLSAAVPYGKAAGAFSGLYYLAEAVATRRFAELMATLPSAPDRGPRPNLAAVNDALYRLDSDVLSIFNGDPAGRAAIGPSARLKEARELAGRGSVEGAALTLLEAELIISSRRPVRPGGGGETAAIAKPPADSIAAMWNARKEVADAAGRTMIDRDVLPLYATLFMRATASKRGPASVTVTLVRWPYT